MDIVVEGKLKTLEEIDKRYQWVPGQDGNLDPNDSGYASLKEKVSKAVSAFPQSVSSFALGAEDLELLDNQDGFSSFERFLAYELISGFNKEHGDRNLLPSYWLALGEAVKNLSQPKNQDWIQKASQAFDQGYNDGKNSSAPSSVLSGFEGLWEAGFADSLLHYGAETIRHSPSPETLLTDMMTGQDLMFAALYGSLGVYEVGHLQEGEEVYGNAYASEVDKYSPYYGQLFACRIFEHYRSLRKSGELGRDEVYIIYEHGGGDGRLARDILGYVQERAKTCPYWRAFWNQLRYEGVEIATSAYETQKLIEADFPGKFTARLGDAITYAPEQKGKGIVISSLLLDSFPHHTLHYADNEWNMGLVIPTIAFANSAQRDEFLNQFFPENKDAVLKESVALSRDYIGEMPGNLLLCFQKEEFEQFSNALSGLKEKDPEAFKQYYSLLKERGQFLRARGDLDAFPEVAGFVDRHSFLQLVTGLETIWVNTEADRYSQNVSRNYFVEGAGAMMTTDLFYPPLQPNSSDIWAISPLMAQRGDTYSNQEKIPMELFGGYVFYSGLQSDQLTEILNKGGAEEISIKPQGELWRYHPKNPENVAKRIYKGPDEEFDSYLDGLTHFNKVNGQYLFAEF